MQSSGRKWNSGSFFIAEQKAVKKRLMILDTRVHCQNGSMLEVMEATKLPTTIRLNPQLGSSVGEVLFFLFYVDHCKLDVANHKRIFQSATSMKVDIQQRAIEQGEIVITYNNVWSNNGHGKWSLQKQLLNTLKATKVRNHDCNSILGGKVWQFETSAKYHVL